MWDLWVLGFSSHLELALQALHLDLLSARDGAVIGCLQGRAGAWGSCCEASGRRHWVGGQGCFALSR